MARVLGYTRVPIERRFFANEVEELEALLLENESRQKNIEQRAREVQMWRYVESEKSKRIQEAQSNIGKEYGHLGAEYGKEGGRGNKKTEDTRTETPLGPWGPKGGLGKIISILSVMLKSNVLPERMTGLLTWQVWAVDKHLREQKLLSQQ